MSGFKFRFAFSNKDINNQTLTQNPSATFAFEFECTSDEEYEDLYIASPQKRGVQLLPTRSSTTEDTIEWHTSRHSKFKDHIAFNIEGDTKLEFINGDNQIYLAWENGGVTSLKRKHIESFLFVTATETRLGIIQCTIYENVLDYGTGPAILHTYIDETHPINEDMEEIAHLLTEAGFEVIYS